MLAVPFFVPVVAMGWAALAPGMGELPEEVQGRLMQVGGQTRVVLLAGHSTAAWVFNGDGRLLGRTEPQPGTPSWAQTLPFVIDGRWLLYLGGHSGDPVEVVHLGRLPLQGGRRRFVSIRLRQPAAAGVWRGSVFPEVRGEAPLLLRCAKQHLLLRTSGGWAKIELRAADGAWAPLMGRPGASCRPVPRPVPRPEVPLPTRQFAEVWLRGGPVALGSASLPSPHLTALWPDRRARRIVGPPPGAPVWGQVVVAGPWVLFAGRSCHLGLLRLTLADLRRGAARSRWTVEHFVEPRQGCVVSELPPAWVCQPRRPGGVGAVRLGLAGGEAALALRDGRPVAAAEIRDCRRMHPLRDQAAPWEGARTLQAGGVRYRVGERFVLRATRGGTQRWKRQLEGPSWILGATDRHLLAVTMPDRLSILDLSNGTLHAEQRVPELYDPLEQRPSLVQWIGSHGQRGYFTLVRSEAWLLRIRRSWLAVFDGEEVRLVD